MSNPGSQAEPLYILQGPCASWWVAWGLCISHAMRDFGASQMHPDPFLLMTVGHWEKWLQLFPSHILKTSHRTAIPLWNHTAYLATLNFLQKGQLGFGEAVLRTQKWCEGRFGVISSHVLWSQAERGQCAHVRNKTWLMQSHCVIFPINVWTF